jgi:hypothetical protein
MPAGMTGVFMWPSGHAIITPKHAKLELHGDFIVNKGYLPLLCVGQSDFPYSAKKRKIQSAAKMKRSISS